MNIQWHNTIQINRPIDQVYAYLADFPRHAEWAQTVERLEKVRDGDSNGVGAVYLTYERQAMQADREPGQPIKAGMPAKTMCEVRALVPNQHIAWYAYMPMVKGVHADWVFELTPTQTGETQLTQRGNFDFSLVPTGLGNLLQMEQKAHVQFEAGLQNIKKVLEGKTHLNGKH